MGAVLMAKVYLKLFPQFIKNLINNPASEAQRQMEKKATQVQTLARQNLLRSTGFDTGRLSASIKVEKITINGVVAFKVGTKVPYWIYIHEGTGIYGPKGEPIKPKNAKALRWRGPGGDVIFARSVKGIPPNPFLRDAFNTVMRG